MMGFTKKVNKIMQTLQVFTMYYVIMFQTVPI